MHQIRIATKQDRAAILAFLKELWNENHVYLKSDELFDYDYLRGDEINFIIATNDAGVLDGILGFIQYAPERAGSDICTVLWKIRPKNGNPSLGMTLLNNLISDYGFRVVSTVGANKKTLPIYEFLGYFVGQLSHYFILNQKLDNYKVIQNSHLVTVPAEAASVSNATLIQYQTFEDLATYFDPEAYKQFAPYKTPWYINRRYYNHPVYKYKAFGIQHQGQTNGVIIAREIDVEGAKVLRVVDYLGDTASLPFAKDGLKEILYDNGYEYIDFYLHGIDDDVLKQAGFLYKKDFEGVVIPNYFEPFEQKNVEINYFTTTEDNFHIFKGDGDQDRPNIL